MVVTDSIQKAMGFEAQMSTIAALTGASSAEMSKMQALALKMGASTKYSAMEAAQAIEELLKAGLRPAAVQAGGLEAALNLATAGGLELAEAAATMATSMNAFKKDAMSAAEVSNILAGTANAAATDVHEISYAIASAGGVADMAGLSFRDLNAVIGLMSNDGLKSGSDAGTSFKTMLMYLQPQTDKATKLFKKLGIGVGAANKFFSKGKIKDIKGIAEVLRTAFDGMSEQDRTNTMLDMFGTDGIKAATTLFKAGAKGVEDFHKEMAKVTALDVAKKKMDNAAGAVEQFKGAIETLQISALLPTMPIIKDLANAAADFVSDYTPEITASIERMVNGARSYVNDNFINNPDFKKLNTFKAKVDFIFQDVMETFNNWWDATGSAKFEQITSAVMRRFVNMLDAAVPQLTVVGLKLGKSLAAGMWDGIMDSRIGVLFNMAPSWLENLTAGDYGDAAKNFVSFGQWGETQAEKHDKKDALETVEYAVKKYNLYAPEDTKPISPSMKLGPQIYPRESNKDHKDLWAKTAKPSVTTNTNHNSFVMENKPTIIIQGNADRQVINEAVSATKIAAEKQARELIAQVGRRTAFQ
ncbi:phage tail tape measure protein [Paenibacillus xanthanilyticus]